MPAAAKSLPQHPKAPAARKTAKISTDSDRTHAWTIVLQNRPEHMDDADKMDWWIDLVKICSNSAIPIEKVIEIVRTECDIPDSSSSSSSEELSAATSQISRDKDNEVAKAGFLGSTTAPVCPPPGVSATNGQDGGGDCHDVSPTISIETSEMDKKPPAK